MQKGRSSTIDILESVETTKQNYKRLIKITNNCLKFFCKNESNVFEILPTQKDIINIIEENDDGEAIYQGQKVKRYLQEKQYIKSHFLEIVEKIQACFEQQFSSVREDPQPFNKVADGGDIIFDICLVSNAAL